MTMLFDFRRQRCENVLFGLVLGVIIALFVIFNQQSCRPSKSSSISVQSLNIVKNESISDGARSLVFVGVMTAEKYLSTRAVAVYETWGHSLPGRMAFFASSYSHPPDNCPQLPLVPLPNVDDSYPPQKKSFLMLQYMWTNFGNSFEWFIRADDDVYIRSDKLEHFLRSVDSNKLQFIGQAGRGNQEEFGLLSLEYDENFCMGGPGVIMSRETLARVAPHIKYCLKNLYTTHEDVELGRCVRRFAKIPCTWSYEMQTILYHNSSGISAFTGNLKSKEVHKAITLHPVKQYQHLYRINSYMKNLKIQELQQDILNAHRDIFAMTNLVENVELDYSMVSNQNNSSLKKLSKNNLLGESIGMNMFQPRLENDILKWEFISRSLFSDTNSNPRRRMENAFQEGMDDVIREVMEMINLYSKQRGRVIEFREILYGYRRNNPLYGADWILDLLLLYKKYRGRKMTIPVRRHLYLHQAFLGIEIQEVSTDIQNNDFIFETKTSYFPQIFKSMQKENFPFQPKDKIIHFILPLSGRFETLKRFLYTYEEVCLKTSENVALYLVYFSNEKENFINMSESMINNLQKNYPNANIKVILVYKYSFARGLALQIGVSHIKTNDSLLFFIDVDMIFTPDTLERIRLNTIQRKQVYFPIVFTQYDPSITLPQSEKITNPFLINENTGHWRHFGFGIGSMYKSDFLSVGGFNTSIQGWGKEDVDLYDKFIANPNLTVFRAVDPTLIHIFHIVHCDPNLERSQLKMCQGTRTDTYGEVKHLAHFLKKYPQILPSYQKFKNHTNSYL